MVILSEKHSPAINLLVKGVSAAVSLCFFLFSFVNTRKLDIRQVILVEGLCVLNLLLGVFMRQITNDIILFHRVLEAMSALQHATGKLLRDNLTFVVWTGLLSPFPV